MDKNTKPVKPQKPLKKPSKDVDRISPSFVVAVVAAGVLVTVSLLGALAWGASRTAEVASDAMNSAVVITSEKMKRAGQYFTFAATVALVQGTDEQRLEVLTQLGQAELNGSTVPQKMVDAVKGNLKHENEEIRLAAQSVMAKFEESVPSVLVDQGAETP